MDVFPRTEDGADGDDWEEKSFFIEGTSSSDDELLMEFDSGQQKHRRMSRKQTAALRESPPLLLAFSIPSRPKLRDSSSPASCLDAQAEGEEEAIEEWMILGRGEQSGDSSIHLNLSYWKSSEEDSLDEGETILDVVLGMT